MNIDDGESLLKQSENADLQSKLFEEAEKSAKEWNEHETKAKELAGELQKVAGLAQ